MRPMTEAETVAVFEKLKKYVGDNLKAIVDRPDGEYCFRLSKDRVYYARKDVFLRANNVGRKELISFGTCIGKITGSGKFMLQITALDLLAQFASHKLWLKPNAEQSYTFGNDVAKSGLGRITEDTEQSQGLVVYSMNDIPLGFAVAARSTAQCRKADPGAVVAFNQADIGEYLREEDTLA